MEPPHISINNSHLLWLWERRWPEEDWIFMLVLLILSGILLNYHWLGNSFLCALCIRMSNFAEPYAPSPR